jgi:hypothetical protein
MPKEGKEPQSYGSEADWVSGRTGQNVNDQKGRPAPEHAEFYDERRDSENSASWQGGRVSEVEPSQEDRLAPTGSKRDASPVSRVTAAEGGSKRGGFFKKRDYE